MRIPGDPRRLRLRAPPLCVLLAFVVVVPMCPGLPVLVLLGTHPEPPVSATAACRGTQPRSWRRLLVVLVAPQIDADRALEPRDRDEVIEMRSQRIVLDA